MEGKGRETEKQGKFVEIFFFPKEKWSSSSGETWCQQSYLQMEEITARLHAVGKDSIQVKQTDDVGERAL